MLRYLRLLGQWALDWIGALGRASLVWFWSLAGLPQRGDMTLLLKQVYQIGVLSLIIIVLSAFSIGGGARAAGIHAAVARSAPKNQWASALRWCCCVNSARW